MTGLWPDPPDSCAWIGLESGLPRGHGRPPARAALSADPEDFRVTEIEKFRPEGAGAHVWLRIRKRGVNTEEVALALARVAGVARSAVGFAGMKDRLAVATQWFSVDLAGRAEPRWVAAPWWAAIESESIEVLEAVSHPRKLRRGALLGNRFEIVLRDAAAGGVGHAVTATGTNRAVAAGSAGPGATAGERNPSAAAGSVSPGAVLRREDLEARLAAIRDRGVPNYFGPQRFGRGGANLRLARSLLVERRRIRDRHRRGLALSAARTLVFNRVLAARAGSGRWASPAPGDVMMLDGSGSVFAPGSAGRAGAAGGTVAERAARGEIHPTGPLWGRGKRLVAGAARGIEDRVAARTAWLCGGLERERLRQERRALRVAVQELECRVESGGRVRLAFTLPPGSYATAVLRELFVLARFR